jgi:hypothetical protein
MSMSSLLNGTVFIFGQCTAGRNPPFFMMLNLLLCSASASHSESLNQLQEYFTSVLSIKYLIQSDKIIHITFQKIVIL